VFCDLFGPTQSEIWRQVSDEIDAQCIQDESEKNRLARAVIEVEHPPWILRLDTYSTSQGRNSTEATRVRIPFVNASGLSLTVYPKTSMSDFGKYFGMQDIIVGDRAFDERMIVQGNDVARIKNIFTDSTLCNMLLSLAGDLVLSSLEPTMLLTVRKDDGDFCRRFPGGIDVCYFECSGILKDKRILKNCIAMCAELIDQLARVGTAVRANETPTKKRY
jgi:hypothetical protein